MSLNVVQHKLRYIPPPLSKLSNKQNYIHVRKVIINFHLLYTHLKTNDIFARMYLISIYIFQVSLRIFA
jgi:hypothetical protein